MCLCVFMVFKISLFIFIPNSLLCTYDSQDNNQLGLPYLELNQIDHIQNLVKAYIYVYNYNNINDSNNNNNHDDKTIKTNALFSHRVHILDHLLMLCFVSGVGVGKCSDFTSSIFLWEVRWLFLLLTRYMI